VTITAQSRVQVIDVPLLAPGSCVLCGTVGGDGRKFLDFGKSIKWYGAVYFCTECFREFAEGAGFIPVATFDKLHNEFRELQVKFDQMQAKYKPVADVLEQFSSNNVADPPIGNYGVFLSSLPSNGEGTESDASDSIESAEGTAETDESTDVERSDDLFDSTDFDDE
jgi:hypothetical protein